MCRYRIVYVRCGLFYATLLSVILIFTLKYRTGPCNGRSLIRFISIFIVCGFPSLYLCTVPTTKLTCHFLQSQIHIYGYLGFFLLGGFGFLHFGSLGADFAHARGK
ncbi:hypothetical protein V8F06_006735 [Rhypophila decipiens]